MSKQKLNSTNWRVTGSETMTETGWRYIYGATGYSNETLTLGTLPGAKKGDVGFIDLGLGASDKVILNKNGSYVLNLEGVEYLSATRAAKETVVDSKGKLGFTTDGSVRSITTGNGNQHIVYTGATLDSKLAMGQGYDSVLFTGDHSYDQYWAFIRRDKLQIDAYNLYSGYKVTLQDSNNIRWGAVEKIETYNSRTDGSNTFDPSRQIPGGSKPTDNSTNMNIDLRSDGQTFSDSFNLAYFNVIRYTSDNIWRGEATISNGSIFSTAGSTLVSGALNIDVIGSYRNGTHDLVVAEQSSEIVGKFRLYAFNVASGLYAQFNDVYLGTASGNSHSFSTNGEGGAEVSDRVAMYGFGGNDTLVGGHANDYLFGGQSTYDLITSPSLGGNQVTGGAGADYFGVGHTNTSGSVTGANGSGVYGGTASYLSGYATDVIQDWQAGYDTLRVLSNGVAVINGLANDGVNNLDDYVVQSMTGNNTINLRFSDATATSDQDGDGPLGGSLIALDKTKSADAWDSSQSDRDIQSITNEDDINVVNDGLIVAKGFAGDDTLLDSSGNDYLYGNAGLNQISLSAGGNDRVFADTRSGTQFVTSFTKDGGAAGDVDKVYLNTQIVEAVGGFRSGADMFAVTNNANNDFLTNGHSLDGGSGIFYNRGWNGWYNSEAYSSSGFSNGGAPSYVYQDAYGHARTLSNIYGGVFMGVGYGLSCIPFIGPALAIIPFAIGATYLAERDGHVNLTYSGTTLESGLNFLKAQYSLNTTVGIADNTSFLSFFNADYRNSQDSFAPTLEFLGLTTGTGAVRTFVTVHSDEETFVYFINSSDNAIQDNEAKLVAEINGLLTVDDFVMYDGSLDIYNFGTDPDGPIVYPPVPVLTVENNNNLGDTVDVLTGETTADSTPVMHITLEDAATLREGDVVSIYDYSISSEDPIKTFTVGSDGVDVGDIAILWEIDSALDHDSSHTYVVVLSGSDGAYSTSNYVNITIDKLGPEILDEIGYDESGYGARYSMALEDQDYVAPEVVGNDSTGLYDGIDLDHATNLSTPSIRVYLKDFQNSITDESGHAVFSNGESAEVGDTVTLHDGDDEIASVTLYSDSRVEDESGGQSSMLLDEDNWAHNSEDWGKYLNTYTNVLKDTVIDTQHYGSDWMLLDETNWPVSLDNPDALAQHGKFLSNLSYVLVPVEVSLVEGDYTLTARITDAAGNSSSGPYDLAIKVDTTDPVLDFNFDADSGGSAFTDADFSFDFTDLSGIADIQITSVTMQNTADGTNWNTETSWVGNSAVDGNSITFTNTSGSMSDTYLAGNDLDHRIQLVAVVTDYAGNVLTINDTFAFDVTGSPV